MIEAARAAVGAGEISFEHGEAAQLASILERHGIEPTLVVVNPPRRGLDDHTLAALRSLAPATIGYVSCSPESLARDLTALAGVGYAIGTVTPVDLMPGTGQIECVVALTR